MEKRSEDRKLGADLLKIRWTDDGGVRHKGHGILEDISTSGIGLKVESKIPEDTVITILYPSGQYQGRVKYCKDHETGFYLGVEFDSGYSWSKPRYTPPHFLELPVTED